MLKKIFLIVACVFLNLNSLMSNVSNPSKNDGTTDNWNILIESIMKIESDFVPNIISKNKQCVGILQITPIVIKDCNRILKQSNSDVRYTLNDRLDKNKSVEIFNIIQSYYNPSKDIEKAIRLWNGGSGYSKTKTERYYQKVIKEYNKRLKEI